MLPGNTAQQTTGKTMRYNEMPLVDIHAELSERIQQYASGLITLPEFFNYTAVLRLYLPRELAGQIDPATGLRFP